MNKILIVDDVGTDRQALKEVVSQVCHNIYLASSGPEALQIAKSEKPDLIFMDIVMDEMSGFEACRTLKESDETAEIPIVFVSSKNSKADQIWAQKQGGVTLVSKPFSPDKIHELVKKLT